MVTRETVGVFGDLRVGTLITEPDTLHRVGTVPYTQIMRVVRTLQMVIMTIICLPLWLRVLRLVTPPRGTTRSLSLDITVSPCNKRPKDETPYPTV